MKLAQRIFNGLTRGLDKLSVGFAHASAFFDMLGIGASVEPADPIEAPGAFSDPYWNRDGQRPPVALDDLLRTVRERAAAEGVLAHIMYVRGKDYVTLAQEVRQKATQPDVAWWRTASDAEKAEKRMELRAQLGRGGVEKPPDGWSDRLSDRPAHWLCRYYYRDGEYVGYVFGEGYHGCGWQGVRVFKIAPWGQARTFAQRHAVQRWVEGHD